MKTAKLKKADLEKMSKTSQSTPSVPHMRADPSVPHMKSAPSVPSITRSNAKSAR